MAVYLIDALGVGQNFISLHIHNVIIALVVLVDCNNGVICSLDLSCLVLELLFH